MKKLFIVLAIASLGFVACNNEAETPATEVDSAAIKDSIAKAEATADSLAKAATDAMPKTDSIAK
jgi:uncharacterized protein YcfL